MKLTNKSAIITGSESGIGLAVAVTYLHNQKAAEATRRFVEGEGGRALVVQTNVREAAQVARLFKETEWQLGSRLSRLTTKAGQLMLAVGETIVDLKNRGMLLSTESPTRPQRGEAHLCRGRQLVAVFRVRERRVEVWCGFLPCGRWAVDGVRTAF